MSEIIVASRPTLVDAQSKISSCENCNPIAEIEFGMIINFIKDANPTDTLFCQTDPVACPTCGHEVWETTLVSFFSPEENLSVL
jgi:hypothetical protein